MKNARGFVVTLVFVLFAICIFGTQKAFAITSNCQGQSYPGPYSVCEAECSDTVHQCNEGLVQGVADTATDYVWKCYGGVTWGEGAVYDYCDIGKPQTGVCGSGAANACSVGTAVNQTSTPHGTGTDYTWSCNGLNGGGSSGTCSYTACGASSGQSCTSSANSCGQTNSGTYSCFGVCSASTPANPSYLGQSCTSAANSCGQTNSGTYNCADVCSASTPANPANYGNACTSAANACGQTNSGTINCSGSCNASTPGNPSNYGNACTSAANSCGDTNSGTINCSGSCTATKPAERANYGNACTSAANSCGQTNSGTINCSGSCSASTPANPSNFGHACTSAANACGMTNSGTINCDNVTCSAATPSNTLCPPSAPTISGTTTPYANITYPYSFSATSPGGVNLAYGIDWNNDGTVDQSSATSTSGWVFSQNNSWSSTGAKTFQAKTIDANGRASGWTSYTVQVKLDGQCSSPQAHYNCLVGATSSAVSGPMQWTWVCGGINGGNTAPCAENKPAPSLPVLTAGPGADIGTSSVSYTFTADDTSGDYVHLAFDWTGTGTTTGNSHTTDVPPNTPQVVMNSWAGAGVKIFKVRSEVTGGPVSAWLTVSENVWVTPTVSWTPASQTIPYNNGTTSFGFTATNATACSYYDSVVDAAHEIPLTPTHATSSSWTNQTYTADVLRYVVCTNPIGQYSAPAQMTVTVQRNDAGNCTITTPTQYLEPGKPFNVALAVLNAGTNPWHSAQQLNTGGTHRLGAWNPQDNTTWGVNRIALDQSSVTTPSSGTFTTNLTAPSTPGNYDFAWRMVEDFSSIAPVWFGQVCSSTAQFIVAYPQLAVAPPSITFPDVVVGDPAVFAPVTLTNLGGGTVSTGTLSFVGSGAFSATTTSFTLGPGASKTINVRFAPSATGTMTGDLHVLGHDTVDRDIDIPLSGIGLDMLIVSGDSADVSSANPITFGDAVLGRSRLLTVYLKNNSTQADMSGLNATTSGPFSCTGACTNLTVVHGTTQKLRLKYTPSALGPQAGTLVVATSSPLFTTGLSGNGVQPVFTTKEK